MRANVRPDAEFSSRHNPAELWSLWSAGQLAQQLMEAAYKLLHESDAALEFMHCELSNNIDFTVPESCAHARHVRKT